jgi:hypothetical protein
VIVKKATQRPVSDKVDGKKGKKAKLGLLVAHRRQWRRELQCRTWADDDEVL